jgi:TonB family protein
MLALTLPAIAAALVTAPAPISTSAALRARERRVWKALTRSSEFSDVPHLTYPRCEEVQPPQALATPDPLLAPILTPTGRNRKVTVSFIIGTDGRVHAPLILESAGPRGDRSVLQTVRTWRYRPGTCNGVPTEIEGKIEFSAR